MSSTFEHILYVAVPAILVGILDALRRLRDVHGLVNSKHTDALNQITALKHEIAAVKKQLASALGEPPPDEQQQPKVDG